MPVPPLPKRRLGITLTLAFFTIVGIMSAAVAVAGCNDKVKPTQPTVVSGTPHVSTPKKPTPPQAITVKGKNNSVKKISSLTGTYKVDYSFGSFCGIVNFLKSDGSDGANFGEMVNDCSSDLNSKVSGSTIVHLDHVTMLKVDNTKGNWTLKFTPLPVV